MRLLFGSILCFGLVAAAEFVAAGRATRSLAFRKGSTFFFRITLKITMFPNSTIFAQAAGFKVAWELPAGTVRPRRSVSDIHEAAELAYESHGFDGRSCLLKNVCQAMEYTGQRNGVFSKILKLLLGSYANMDGSSRDDEEDPIHCDYHVRNCPLQLIGIDSFIEQ